MRPYDIKSSIELITPQVAETYLQNNPCNRQLDDHRVTTLAREIREGRWRLNGESIIFSDGGELLDGQHRLWAIVMAEQPIQSLVVRGVPKAVFETIDLGAKRNSRDILEIRGVKRANVLGPAATWLTRYTRGTMRGMGPTRTPYAYTLANLVEQNPGLAKAAEFIEQFGKVRLLSRGMATTLLYLMRKVDEKQADQFFRDLFTGVGVEDGSPVQMLRERLFESVTSASRRMTDPAKAALTIKAWNFSRAGKRVERLFFKAHGEKREEFPTIDGLKL